jgi:hypothetical protein
LREAGLVDVAAAGSFPIGGPVLDRLEIATMRQVRAELVAAGLADDAEIDAHVAAVGAGELDLTLAPLISAWGRRPDQRDATRDSPARKGLDYRANAGRSAAAGVSKRRR